MADRVERVKIIFDSNIKDIKKQLAEIRQNARINVGGSAVGTGRAGSNLGGLAVAGAIGALARGSNRGRAGGSSGSINSNIAPRNSSINLSAVVNAQNKANSTLEKLYKLQESNAKKAINEEKKVTTGLKVKYRPGALNTKADEINYQSLLGKSSSKKVTMLPKQFPGFGRAMAAKIPKGNITFTDMTQPYSIDEVAQLRKPSILSRIGAKIKNTGSRFASGYNSINDRATDWVNNKAASAWSATKKFGKNVWSGIKNPTKWKNLGIASIGGSVGKGLLKGSIGGLGLLGGGFNLAGKGLLSGGRLGLNGINKLSDMGIKGVTGTFKFLSGALKNVAKYGGIAVAAFIGLAVALKKSLGPAIEFQKIQSRFIARQGVVMGTRNSNTLRAAARSSGVSINELAGTSETLQSMGINGTLATNIATKLPNAAEQMGIETGKLTDVISSLLSGDKVGFERLTGKSIGSMGILQSEGQLIQTPAAIATLIEKWLSTFKPKDLNTIDTKQNRVMTNFTDLMIKIGSTALPAFNVQLDKLLGKLEQWQKSLDINLGPLVTNMGVTIQTLGELFEMFVNNVKSNGLWDGIKTALKPVGDLIMDSIKATGQFLIDIMPLIPGYLSEGFSKGMDIFEKFWKWAMQLFAAVFSDTLLSTIASMNIPVISVKAQKSIDDRNINAGYKILTNFQKDDAFKGIIESTQKNPVLLPEMLKMFGDIGARGTGANISSDMLNNFFGGSNKKLAEFIQNFGGKFSEIGYGINKPLSDNMSRAELDKELTDKLDKLGETIKVSFNTRMATPIGMYKENLAQDKKDEFKNQLNNQIAEIEKALIESSRSTPQSYNTQAELFNLLKELKNFQSANITDTETQTRILNKLQDIQTQQKDFLETIANEFINPPLGVN